MEIIDVVQKLIGPVQPIADSAVDYDRLHNLKEMMKLTERLLFDINQVANGKDSNFASVMTAGQIAHKFLTEIKEA